MTVPRSIYPRPISAKTLKKGLQQLDRRQRERFFVLVVRMIAERLENGRNEARLPTT